MALSHSISFFVFILAAYQNDALRLASSTLDPGTDADTFYEALDEFEHSQMAMQSDFDDGVEWGAEVGEFTTKSYSRSGFDVARLWNKCKTNLKRYGTHYIDSVASRQHNFLYIDNVKAGSSTIRYMLEQNLKIDWMHTDIKVARPTGQGGRYSSRDFNDTTRMFRFSVVRDPVAKFESGVRQAKAQNPRDFVNMNADEILKDVMTKGRFTNEHLQPSSFRLSAYDASTPPSMHNLDFIGKVEEIEHDWPIIIDSMENLEEETRKRMKVLHKMNSRTAHSDTRLSEAAIRQMCKSDMYRLEWECFGYDIPKVCHQD